MKTYTVTVYEERSSYYHWKVDANSEKEAKEHAVKKTRGGNLGHLEGKVIHSEPVEVSEYAPPPLPKKLKKAKKE